MTASSRGVEIAVILGFSPVAILSSYVLRIATVARRTVAITPFVAPPSEEFGTTDEER